MGGSRTEGSSAIRDGGQAAMTLMGQFRVLESLQLEGSQVGDLQHFYIKIYLKCKISYFNMKSQSVRATLSTVKVL